MIVSHLCKLAFIHIPKTGGTSIQRTLQTIDGRTLRLGHRTFTQFCARYPEHLDYYKFTIVRNPWARLFSYFTMKNNPDPKYLTTENFSRYVAGRVQLNSDPPHLMMYNQCHYIDADGAQLDFIGRFETLENDFLTIMKNQGFPITSFPNVNKSALPLGKSYKDFYSADTLEFVATHYAEDIERFGYTF